MDNNNDAFNSLGLDGITMQDTNTQAAPAPDATTDNSAPAAPAEPSAQPAQDQTQPQGQAQEQAQSKNSDEALNDLSDEETIDLFIEGIMDEKGVNAPTEEIYQDLKNDLKNQLLQQIDRSLITELPDEKLDELNRMAAANGQIDPEVIAKMIEEANLDITDIVGNTMLRFREIYLGLDKTEQTEE